MSVALVVTRGYGNGTLTGSIAQVAARGYITGPALLINAYFNYQATIKNRTFKAVNYE